MKIECPENMGSESAKELQRREHAETPHEKEEGSQASATSAEPSLSAHETSGATFSPIACSQPSCNSTSSSLHCSEVDIRLCTMAVAGHMPDNATLSSMETPKAAEARLPAMGKCYCHRSSGLHTHHGCPC